MFCALTGDARWFHALAAAAFLAASAPHTAPLAQGLDDPEAIESIIGSDVSVAESGAREEDEAVTAAIENLPAAIEEARKKFMLDNVEIVFLPGIRNPASAVGGKIEEHAEEIAELHQVIEGNAMFYHAIDSHSIMIGDIVALEFDDANGVKIYAEGEAPAE